MTILEQNINLFFKFFTESLEEWNKKEIELLSKNNIKINDDSKNNVNTTSDDNINLCDNINTNSDENIIENSTEKKEYKSNTFINYWCYKLYSLFGIKRKYYQYGADFTEAELTDNPKLSKIYGQSKKILMQFFYDKGKKNYNKNHPICQICRHLMFDIDSMSIVSIGVTKSIDYNIFLNNLKLNINLNENTDYEQKIVFEEFLEGTMVIFNPFLNKFNFKKIIEIHENEDNSSNQITNNNKSNVTTNSIKDDVYQQFLKKSTNSYASKLKESIESNASSENKDTNACNSTNDILENSNNDNIKRIEKEYNFEISSRKIIGTSYFNNREITFEDMFLENAKLQNMDLSKLRAFKNHGYIFNIQHKENRVVNPEETNCNTLVACYKFKNTKINSKLFDNIQDKLLNIDINTNNVNKTSDISKNLKSLAIKLSKDSIIDVNLNTLIKSNKLKTNIVIPKVLDEIVINKSFNVNDFEKIIKDIMDKQDKFNPGIMIKDLDNSIRSKYRNEDYSFLLEIKGNKPINICEENKEYLFKLYWRLRKNRENNITTFIKNFDNENQSYNKIFNWYRECIHTFTKNLHKEYLSVFIQKNKTFQDLEYEIKPLCFELHKLFLEKTHKAITLTVVQNFVNNLEFYQMYWRLFGLNQKEDKNENRNKNSNDSKSKIIINRINQNDL